MINEQLTATEYLSSQAKEEASLPLITVAMPVYNAGKYLRLAVLSIVGQTYSNWELLIIDDGSTDNSLKNIADLKDERIKILSDGNNRGLAVRLNESIDLARGLYFARMDGDDICYPERFSQQITAFENNPELDLLATRVITIDENNQITGLFPYAISHEEICAQPWLGFYLPHPTWMGKTDWFRKYRYTIPGPYCCEDQELLLRSYHNSHLETLDEILLAYRIRNKIDWKKLARTRRTVFSAQFQYFARLNLWHYLLLATAAFIGKIINDFLKKILGSTFQLRQNIVSDLLLTQWQNIFDGLTSRTKIP